jgi:FdhD protein
MMKTISPLTSRGKKTKNTPTSPSVASQSFLSHPRKSASSMGGTIPEVRLRGPHALVDVEGAEDAVAVEEPLEIRVDGRALAVTMRTPGHDEELALGFLHGEGLIDGPRAAGPPPDLAANAVEVEGPLLRDPGERRFYTTSSCGVCGKGALDQVAVDAPPLTQGPAVPRSLLAALPDRLRASQPTFDRTGGLHATGLFTAGGELVVAREDVGRHNAMDKVVGWALRAGRVPLSGHLLCVSGRLSFELVQKAAVAGAPVLVGVGAPSSLAVALARDRGLTLGGFARGGRVKVYSASERVMSD